MKTGGHIKPCKVGSVEEHNERNPEYVERMKHSKHPLNFYPTLAKRPNFDWKNSEREQYRDKVTGKPLKVAQVFNQMIAVYQEHDKRHRRPPLKDRERLNKKTGKMETVAGWSPIREAVIITKHDTKPEDFNPVMEWFRQNGVEPMFLDLHFDEGHIDQDTGEFMCNHHAHLGLDFFDWNTGKTIKLGPKKMSELQTVLADALGMERGELKEVTNRDYMDIPEYREYAEALTQKKKEVNEVDAVLTEKHEQNQQLSDENARLRRENAALQTKNALGGAASAVGQSIAGLFGQSSKDKAIQQLQDTIAHEPERTEAAVASARTDERQKVITEICKTARFKSDNHTAETIGQRWRVNVDAKNDLKQEVADLKEQHKKDLAAKDAVITKRDNTIQEVSEKHGTLLSLLYDIWKGLKEAIEAIVSRVTAGRDYFTDAEVKKIEGAMASAGDDEDRKQYAKDIFTVAGTVTDTDEELSHDLTAIATNSYDNTEKVMEEERQSRRGGIGY